MKKFNKYLLILFIIIISATSCKNSYKLTDTSSNNKAVSENLSTYNFSEVNIELFRDSLQSTMNEILNTSNTFMDVASPEGILGNFICDLSLNVIRKNIIGDLNSNEKIFCMFNNGGIRTSLPKGDITRGKIYEIMPFDNELVIVKISATKMQELFLYILNKSIIKDSRKAGVPVSGLRMLINNNKIENIFIGTKQYNQKYSYSILTTDYLARGGDGMVFFKDAIEIKQTGLLLRDVIIDYIINLKKQNIIIDASLDGRIYAK